jgi:hypothetical protein
MNFFVSFVGRCCHAKIFYSFMESGLFLLYVVFSYAAIFEKEGKEEPLSLT